MGDLPDRVSRHALDATVANHGGADARSETEIEHSPRTLRRTTGGLGVGTRIRICVENRRPDQPTRQTTAHPRGEGIPIKNGEVGEELDRPSTGVKKPGHGNPQRRGWPTVKGSAHSLDEGVEDRSGGIGGNQLHTFVLQPTAIQKDGLQTRPTQIAADRKSRRPVQSEVLSERNRDLQRDHDIFSIRSATRFE